MKIARRPQYRLTSPSKTLDRRTSAARGDMADIALAGKIFVPHYSEPYSKSVIVDRAGIYHKPSTDAVLDSELLRGERFAVLDITGDWAWGYCEHDHYVGYLRVEHLGAVYEVEAQSTVEDWPEYALSYLDVPYLWGGRSRHGIDCSGLVQVALAQAKVRAPRDADQQLLALGRLVDATTPPARGDLIFFPGHVGIMVDDTDMVHATGFHGRVVVEPLDIVSARIAERFAQSILARKRLL